MRPFSLPTLISLVAITMLTGQSLAQDCVLPRAHHAWGRYQVGSWKEVRVTTETLSPEGKVVNSCVTETKSTLSSVNDLGVMLSVEVLVQADGKQFASPPQVVWNGFYGQQEQQRVTVRRLGESVINVNGVQYPCEQRQIVYEGTRGRQMSVCYSPRLSPYILKRETVSGDVDGSPTRTVAEAVAINKEVDVLGTPRVAAMIKTTMNLGKATRVTVETISDEVPGGVIQHDSQEFDEQGRVIRRSKLELLAYEIHEPRAANEPERRRLFHRRDRRQDRM